MLGIMKPTYLTCSLDCCHKILNTVVVFFTQMHIFNHSFLNFANGTSPKYAFKALQLNLSIFYSFEQLDFYPQWFVGSGSIHLGINYSVLIETKRYE
jgi:hypothetical protein